MATITPEDASADELPEYEGDSRLTDSKIYEATGEKELERIEEIEIIFMEVTDIASLESCVNLRSLTLIGTQLSRISNVSCVGHCLQRLCLIDQHLEKIENLRLPALKELYLQNNDITKMQGFEYCKRLRKLWLYSNRIVKIEGLHCLPELKELWLQDNQISSLDGLANCGSLETLNVAANPISEFKEIQKLSTLPLLHDIGFSDSLFGACPVTRQEGYRPFVTCALKHITFLDCSEVGGEERRLAEDLYLTKIMAFNDRVESLCRDSEQLLRSVDVRRKTAVQEGSKAKEELTAMFNSLENVVVEGRKKIAKEYIRQKKVRGETLAALESELRGISEEYSEEVNNLIDLEQQRMLREKKWLRMKKLQLYLDMHYCTKLSALPYTSNGVVSVHPLPTSSAELNFIKAHCASASSHDVQPPMTLSLVSGFGIHNSVLSKDFPSVSPQQTFRLFYATPDEDRLAAIVQHGFSAVFRSDPFVLLHSSPWKAIRSAKLHVRFSHRSLAGRFHLDIDGTRDFSLPVPPRGSDLLRVPAVRTDGLAEEEKSSAAVDSECSLLSPKYASLLAECEEIHFTCAVLMVKVAMPADMKVLSDSGNVASLRDAADIFKPLDDSVSAVMVPCGPSSSSKSASKKKRFTLVLRQSVNSSMLPEYFSLMSGSLQEDAIGHPRLPGGGPVTCLDDLLSELASMRSVKGTEDAADLRALLGRFEQRAQASVEAFEDRAWKEIDPRTSALLASGDREVQELTHLLEEIRSQIDREKGAQEKVLREFRTSTAGSRSGRGASQMRSSVGSLPY